MLSIKQILNCEHQLVGRGSVEEVLIGAEVTLSVDKVIGVLAVLVSQQVVAGNLLEESPVLAEEVREVQDVKP